MIHRHIHESGIKRRGIAHLAFVFGNAREPFPVCRVHHRPIQSGRNAVIAVIEEEEIVNLAHSGGETEVDVRAAEDRFDIRDLLLDETD